MLCHCCCSACRDTAPTGQECHLQHHHCCTQRQQLGGDTVCTATAGETPCWGAAPISHVQHVCKLFLNCLNGKDCLKQLATEWSTDSGGDDSLLHLMFTNYSTRCCCCSHCTRCATRWGVKLVTLNLQVALLLLLLLQCATRWGLFLIFASCTALGVIALWLVVPETRGLELEQVHLAWESHWLWGRKLPTTPASQTAAGVSAVQGTPATSAGSGSKLSSYSQIQTMEAIELLVNGSREQTGK